MNKFVKLFEEFTGLTDAWVELARVNKNYKAAWRKNKLSVDFETGTKLEYNDDFTYKFDWMKKTPKVNYLKDLIPVDFKAIHGNLNLTLLHVENLVGSPEEVLGHFKIQTLNNLKSLYGMPKVANNFNIQGCSKLLSLYGATEKAKTFEFGKTYILTFKYLPAEANVLLTYGGGTETKNLLSMVAPNGEKIYANNNAHQDNFRNVKYFLDNGNIDIALWYEALAYVGVRDKQMYDIIISDKILKKYCEFTQEQVEEIYKSDLIDYESTLVDAVAAGLPVPSDFLARMKGYDHSEYRDSKLDSEWKEVF